MNRGFLGRKSVLSLCLVLAWGLMWVGCGSTLKEKGPESGRGADMGVGKYYYFDDVLVPKDLSLDMEESFVYETSQFKAGTMVFSKWWLDPSSLVDFFAYYMEKDNWKMVNSFRGEESVLNFSKPDKTCTIKIREKWTGTTVVEIQVGPVGMKKM